MAFLPVVLMAASAAVSAIGAIKQGQAASASYKSSANAARYNAEVSTQNAHAAEAAASANELAMRRQNDQRMGAMRALAAESGGFTGTNLTLLDQSASAMELDALNTRYRGQIQSRGLLAEANLDEYQAKAAQTNAGYAMTGGYLGAAAGALGSVSNYYNFRSLNYTGG